MSAESGLHRGEFYELDQAGSDICLTTYAGTPDAPIARGGLLARALHARQHPALPAWYLTPARAEKWRLLFLGDFYPMQRQIRRVARVWFYVAPDGRKLTLAEAVKLARGAQARNGVAS